MAAGKKRPAGSMGTREREEFWMLEPAVSVIEVLAEDLEDYKLKAFHNFTSVPSSLFSSKGTRPRCVYQPVPAAWYITVALVSFTAQKGRRAERCRPRMRLALLALNHSLFSALFAFHSPHGLQPEGMSFTRRHGVARVQRGCLRLYASFLLAQEPGGVGMLQRVGWERQGRQQSPRHKCLTAGAKHPLPQPRASLTL